MAEGQELAKEYGDIRGWQINKVHSRAKIRHGAMKPKEDSITVDLAKSNSWFNIEAIMIQWVGLGLQIADKASLKDWWYDEGRHGTMMSEISEQDAKQMALDAIDIERIEG